MHHFVRRAPLVAAVALLAGCSLSSSTPTTPPGAANPASLTRAAAARPDRTNAIYSTHVAFAGPDGRHYTGNAVVFPKQLFPGLHVPGLSAATRGAAPSTAGALFFYLGVPGVKGDETIRGYGNWIDVDAFSIGYGPGSNQHRPVTDLSVDKGSDIASPFLFGGVVSGSPFMGPVPGGAANVMELDVVQSVAGVAPQKVMYFTFSHPTATSFSSAFASADGLTETVTIAYDKAQFRVIPVNKAGQAQPPVCNTWTPSLAAR